MDFKVKCIKSDGTAFTVGEIYEIKDKRITINGGIVSGRIFGSLDDLNQFYKSQFELVEDNIKKEDLKVGYVVETRNGELNIVMPYKDGTCIVDEDGYWLGLESYNENLAMGDKALDIVKVYGLSIYPGNSASASTKFRELLWERKEIAEVTLQEIADWKGVSVENVRII